MLLVLDNILKVNLGYECKMYWCYLWKIYWGFLIFKFFFFKGWGNKKKDL